MAEVVARPETSCALCAFEKGWDPYSTRTRFLKWGQVHCVSPVFFALLFFHLSKAFPCGPDPANRLTVCRCRHGMGPAGTSHCVLNCIFNEETTTG